VNHRGDAEKEAKTPAQKKNAADGGKKKEEEKGKKKTSTQKIETNRQRAGTRPSRRGQKVLSHEPWYEITIKKGVTRKKGEQPEVGGGIKLNK